MRLIEDLQFTIKPSDQFSHSVMSDSLWPHGLQHTRLPCPSPTPGAYSNTPSHQSITSVMPSNHLILCCPLLLLPSIFPSIRVFSKKSVLQISGPKHWIFSFNISLSSEYSGLISLRIDWFDFLQSNRFSRVFSKTIVQKHRFFSAQVSLWSNSHIHTWLLEKP